MNPSKATLLGVALAAACARQPAPAAPAPTAPAAPTSGAPAAAATVAALPIPDVGSNAPNFTFTPVTKDGVGKPEKLSDYKNQTVVLWFFIKARTRG